MKAKHKLDLSGAAIVLVAAVSLASCGKPNTSTVKPDQTAGMSAEAKRVYVEKKVDRWPVVGSNSGTFAVDLNKEECKNLLGEVTADLSCPFNHQTCQVTTGGTTVRSCITEE